MSRGVISHWGSLLIRIACIAAFCMAAVTAKAAEEGVPWLNQIAPMRTGAARSFQFRVDIDCMAEQLVAYVSWAPPDRRCVVLCDRVDGLPLMIAVDGRVWMYDLIGGQILLIRGEPQLLARIIGDDFQSRYGLRADFPDDDSRITINFEPAAIITCFARQSPQGFTVDADNQVASAAHGIALATFSVDKKNPGQPTSFDLEMADANRKVSFRFDSFVFGQDIPAWHHPVNQEALAKHVPIVAVADAKMLSPEAQERLAKFRGLWNGGGAFILRSALRDDVLLRAIEANSPIKLDFDEIRANHEKLKAVWRAALSEQGFNLLMKPVAEPVVDPVDMHPTP